jgi:hypothetical protein
LFIIAFAKNCYNLDIDHLLFLCRFASIIIIFQEALQFKDTIMFCYNRQSAIRMTTKFPPPWTWHICQIVVDCLSLILIVCVLNQSRGYWLLSDALHFAISMTLKLREPKNAPSFQTLMEEDSNVAFELICLASNIRKKVCEVLDSFLSFLKNFDERKTHNMLALLLDSRF